MRSVTIRAPLALPAVFLPLGILLTHLAGPALALGLAGACLGLAGLIRPVRIPALACALGLLTGVALHPTDPATAFGPDADLHLVEGTVLAAPPVAGDPAMRTGTLLVLRVGTGREARAVRLTLQLRGHRRLWPVGAREVGARLRLVVRVRAPAPGRHWLVGRLVSRASVHVLAPAPARQRRIGAWRQAAVRGYDAALDSMDAGLARALVAGDRSALGPADRRRFRNAGQAHLLAVSGMHVALVIGGLVFLLRQAGLGLWPTQLLAILGVVIYVPFAGASPSAVRAGIGALLYLAAPLLGRPTTGLVVLSAVAVLVFAFEPAAWTRIGLVLSMSAVLGILVLGPPLSEAFVPRDPRFPGAPPPTRAWFRRGLAISFAAWCGTLPLIASQFGRVCLIAAPLSVLAMPFVALLVASALLLLALEPLPGLQNAVATVFHHTADLLRLLFDGVQALGLDAARVPSPPIAWHLAYGAGVVGIVRAQRRGRLVSLALLLALAGILTTHNVEPGTSGARGYDPASAVRHPDPAGPEEQMDGTALILAALGLAGFAVLSAHPLGWLTRGGAATACGLGVGTAWQFGWAGLAALFATFLVTTALSKLPGRHRAGARTAKQVLANGLGSAGGILVAAAGAPGAGIALFLGGLAFLGADTTSSEIGTRYGGPPRRLRSRERLAPGMSGGVTWLGTLTGIGGALLPGLAYAIVIGGAWLLIPWIGLAGVLGSVCDSWLGDTVQYRGRSHETGALTEQTTEQGVATAHHSGYRWLDNDGVNLVSSLAASAAAWLLVQLIW